MAASILTIKAAILEWWSKTRLIDLHHVYEILNLPDLCGV